MKLKNLALLALASLTLLTLAACTNLPGSDPLDGTVWKLTAYDGKAPLPGTTITARFEKGQVNGSAGCNSYGGTYQAGKDKLQLGEIASTLMACLDNQVMEQETAFMQLFTQVRTFQLNEGQLLLFTADSKTLIFAPTQ